DGDKSEAERVFGYRVDTYGIGDLVARISSVDEEAVGHLCRCYSDSYDLDPALQSGGARHESLREAARIEVGLRRFLGDLGASAFTDTFEDLHGVRQLPGIATQRLMADGFGFGAEGDWKTSALLRAMKVMGHGLGAGRDGFGTSFMEDYTYHMEPGRERVLGAHMLEICPTIASTKPRCEVHPLGIGGKEDPVRLVFDAPAGDALNATIVDMGGRLRMIVNAVEAVDADAPLPNLPVARAVWIPRPSFERGLAEWIEAGGAHHTGYSYTVTAEMLRDFARMAGIECLTIGCDD
ncbi:MAG: L-arabinose isomerase, partial [Phycisphaerales bacterium]|nr:L-arabinose isomerase [Phycisphaerales bacterium]